MIEQTLFDKKREEHISRYFKLGLSSIWDNWRLELGIFGIWDNWRWELGIDRDWGIKGIKDWDISES